MYWIYYTQQTPLSWKDRILIEYLTSQGMEIKCREIYPKISARDIDQIDEYILEEEGGREFGIIFSNMYEKELSNFRGSNHVNDDFYEFFLPLLFAEFCKRRGIHFTYLTQEYLSGIQSKEYVRKLLEMKGMLYLNFWIIMNEDTNAKENGFVQFVDQAHRFCCGNEYHISVSSDLFPIVFDMIHQQKIGSYEMTNPTSIDFSKIVSLYSEYISKHVNGITDEDVGTYPCHKGINTNILESEYFVLPSYQALQRLMKRVRKTSMVRRDIKLQSKCCVMVTGGFGFIGSNLIHYLYHQFPKCQIVNIDRLDYCSRKENLDDLLGSERVTCYQIDLCETEKVEKILRDHCVDYIFHLAAQSHVDNSFNNSLQFSRDNMYGTHSLLEACKNYGRIIRFLHVSTDEIYGETLQKDPFTEDVLPNPTNPYAATKVGAEYIVKSYFHCFELPIVIVRGNNVYGPRQYPEKMIPKFITSTLDVRPCTVAGNGLMQRNFIYVEDVCRGLVSVMEHGQIDQIYNIGSDDEKSVLEIAKQIIQKMTGKDSEQDVCKQIIFVKDRYYNDFRYSINSDKIRKLGWKPKMTFDEGLQKTIQFYTENIELYRDKEMDVNEKVVENEKKLSYL